MGLLEQKKEEKRKALLDAAYELFSQRGTNKTSVSDIADKANVAKGTFYLYFKDKDAVLQALLGRISYRVVGDAITQVEAQGLASFPDQVVALIDYIIEHFRRDQLSLKLMQRNFTWPTPEEFVAAAQHDDLLAKIRRSLLATPEAAQYTEKELFLRMSVLIGMCISVCYTSILENKPEPIDDLKPVLYDMVRRAL